MSSERCEGWKWMKKTVKEDRGRRGEVGMCIGRE